MMALSPHCLQRDLFPLALSTTVIGSLSSHWIDPSSGHPRNILGDSFCPWVVLGDSHEHGSILWDGPNACVYRLWQLDQ